MKFRPRSDWIVGIACFFLTIAIFVAGALFALRALQRCLTDTW